MATSALSFGPVPIFTALWKKLGLPEAIALATQRETATYDPAPVIFRMVLGRLLCPQSKLSTHRWAETIWWDDGAVVELQQYYRSLGILSRSIKKIEEHLYHWQRDLFTPAPDLLFFDTTSTYFTGEGPMTEMACRGFSKDNHPEDKQVMVGVVMTREGTPLAHHVFPGNTLDAEAFSEVIEELSKRFGIKRVIVVGDRGMFNAKVIARIEELKLEYIAGVKMRQDWDVKEIVLENKAPFETVADNLKVKLVELGEERYIVCLNEEEAKRDRAVREEIVADLKEKIAKGPKKMIGNKGYRRYLSVEKDAVQINEEKIVSEKKFDGIFVLRTNTNLSAREAALAYKGLWQVERAFREIKTTFEIRPVYLSREDRIKGHIAVCFLAFCLQVALTGPRSRHAYPESLRRVAFYDVQNRRRLVFLTNLFCVSPKTVADIYKQRWQVELFFKWIKGHLRIKSFYGTSANAVKTQVWVAIIVYLLVAIVKKRLKLQPTLHTLLQIVEVNLFEKIDIIQLVTKALRQELMAETGNQLNLFGS